MSESQQHSTPKRERKPAKPWKRVFFRLNDETEHASKKQDEMMEEGLEKIYAEGDSLSELDKGSSWWWLKWVVVVSVCLVLLTGLMWWGMSVIKPNQSPSLAALAVELQGPDRVKSGEEVEYVITWKNQSFQTVQDVSLRIGIPPAVQVTYMDPWPIDPKTNSWKLGLIGAGNQGKITIRGIAYGDIGYETAIQAVMTAPDQNGVDIQDALSTKSIHISDSVFVETWSVPERLVAGEQVAIEYALFHAGTKPLDNVTVAVLAPESFTTSSSKKELKRIDPNTTTTVRLVGAFNVAGAGAQTITSSVSQMVKEQAIQLRTSSTTATVLASDLSLQLVANGSTVDKTVLPGDAIRATLAYSNTSPDTLEDIKLVLQFETIKNGHSATGTSMLAWSALEDGSKGVTSTKTLLQTVTYSKTQIPALASLKPGDRGTIDVVLPTMRATTGTKDVSIRVSGLGSIGKAAGKEVKRQVQTPTVSLRYRSDAVFILSPRYYTEEGAPIGSGPLPPQVGSSTSYRVYWSLQKSLHSLKDITVTTTLPDTVIFSGKTESSAGEWHFEPNGRVLSWKLNTLPEDVNEVSGWFELVLQPKSADVGRFATLLQSSTFSAMDTITDEMLRQTVNVITTDLEDDESARGKGVVRKK